MRISRLPGKIGRFVVIVYAAFVIAWFLTYLFIQDSWWGLVLLDKFAEYFILPSGFIFLLSILCRKASAKLLASIPVLICLYFYSSFFLPISFPGRLLVDQQFRVATYNVWNQNTELNQIINVVIGTEADVIALQEITESQRDVLIAGLQPQYPHNYVSKPVNGGTTAIFSRTPLSNVTELDIQIDRPSILANVEWNKQVVTVVAAHLNPSFWAYWRQPWQKIPGNFVKYIKDQNEQVLAIQNELLQRGDVVATFLACDCNSQETASTNRLLEKTFKDTFRSIGWQLGSTPDPNLRFERNLTHIDYIWFSGKAKPTAIYRGRQTAGSDHEPVIADFRLGVEP